MSLDRLSPPAGAKKNPKRLGRGKGSGTGKTAGKGHKGQKSRSGVSLRGFEGGQMPLQRRLPKRGFKNPFRVEFQVVNVEFLNQFDAGTVVDLDQLRESGLIRNNPKMGVKILGTGDLTKALTVKANCFSDSARRKIEQAGGSTEVI